MHAILVWCNTLITGKQNSSLRGSQSSIRKPSHLPPREPSRIPGVGINFCKQLPASWYWHKTEILITFWNCNLYYKTSLLLSPRVLRFFKDLAHACLLSQCIMVSELQDPKPSEQGRHRHAYVVLLSLFHSRWNFSDSEMIALHLDHMITVHIILETNDLSLVTFQNLLKL